MTRSDVAVVIPALDEATNIGRVVTEVLASGDHDVIVVDNGSVDGTAEVARDAGAVVCTEPRRGYGFACASGVREATRRDAGIIVFMDGDGSSRASELDRLIEPIASGRADMVLGSRMRGHIEPGAMPAHQRVGNRMVSMVMRVIYGVDVTDLGPFRAIRAPLLDRLAMTEMTFGWPTEMMVKAATRGAYIVEVPVTWDRRAGGDSKVGGTLRGSLLAAVDIVRVTVRHAKLRPRSRSVS